MQIKIKLKNFSFEGKYYKKAVIKIETPDCNIPTEEELTEYVKNALHDTLH